MGYKSIYKCFVSENDFEKIYESRFHSESSYHFDLEINGYKAFMFLHPDISNQLSRIRVLDKELEMIFLELPEFIKEQYKRKCLIDEIQYNNSIEGVVSTRKDINEILEKIETKKTNGYVFKEIIMKYVSFDSALKVSVPLNSSSDIRELYDQILLDEIISSDPNNKHDGDIFRKDGVNVTRGDEKTIHKGITPETKIIEYMDKALNVLNDESIDVILRVAIFHYLFGYIHPFYDGNGRLNRFISSYMLSKHLTSVMPYRLSMSIKENISQYYNAFKYTNDVRNRGDISTFVYEFLDIIIKSYESTKLYILMKDRYMNELTEKIHNLDISSSMKDILVYLSQVSIFSNAGISKEILCLKLNIKGTKCRNLIYELKKLGYIVEHNISKSIYYSANLEKLD